MDDAHTISARVNTVTDRHADLSVDGQALRWPTSALPDDVRVGDTVKLTLVSAATEAVDRHEHARALLAEILGHRS